MAPQILVDSAQAGTLLAPLSAVVAFAIFILCGSYALSGAGLIRKLPFLNLGIYVIAVVCILRGLLPLQLWIRHPEKVNDAVLIVGLVWMAVGLCYFFGYRAVIRSE